MDITEKIKEAFNACENFRYECTGVTPKGKRFMLTTSSGFRWYTHQVDKETWVVYPTRKGAPGVFWIKVSE